MATNNIGSQLSSVESNFYCLLKTHLKLIANNNVTNRTSLRVNGRDDPSAIDFWAMICFVESLYSYSYGIIDNRYIGELPKKKKDRKKKLESEIYRKTNSEVIPSMFETPCHILLSEGHEEYLNLFDNEPSYLGDEHDETKVEYIIIQLSNLVRQQEMRFWIHIGHILMFIEKYHEIIVKQFIGNNFEYLNPIADEEDQRRQMMIELRSGTSDFNNIYDADNTKTNRAKKSKSKAKRKSNRRHRKTSTRSTSSNDSQLLVTNTRDTRDTRDARDTRDSYRSRDVVKHSRSRTSSDSDDMSDIDRRLSDLRTDHTRDHTRRDMHDDHRRSSSRASSKKK